MTPNSTPIPRVVVPDTVRKNDVFVVKSLISHRMETGLRHDERGVTIPRKIINKFSCIYGEDLAFSVDLHEAVSANPFIEFSLVATESARLKFVWEEDGGRAYSVSHDLTVE